MSDTLASFSSAMRASLCYDVKRLPPEEKHHITQWFSTNSAAVWSGEHAFRKSKTSAFELVRLCMELCGWAKMDLLPSTEILRAAFDIAAETILKVTLDWDLIENNWVPTILSDAKRYDRIATHIKLKQSGYDFSAYLVDECSPKPQNTWERRAAVCFARLHIQNALAEEKAQPMEKPALTIPGLREALRDNKLRSNVDRVFDECNIRAQIQWAVYADDKRLTDYANRIIDATGFAPTEETKRWPFFAFRVLAEYEFRSNAKRYQMADWEAVPFITAQLLEKFRDELKQQLADFKAKRSAQSGKAQMMCNRLNMPEQHTHATYRAAYLWALRKLEHPETKTPVKEKTVSNKPYETIDYVYGKNLEQATADDLIEAIRRVRAEVDSLKPLEDSKSKHIAKKIEELQTAEAKIVKALDAKK